MDHTFRGSIALPRSSAPITARSLPCRVLPLHASLSRTVAGYVGIRHS